MIKKASPWVSAEAHLAGCDPAWAQLIEVVGPCTHQPEPDRSPYASLIRAVAYQQLHGKAAAAILARLCALVPEADPLPEPAALLALEPEALRRCGFSVRKVATLRAVAEAALNGEVPTRADAAAMDDEALIQQLTALPGIGRWTVEMLLIDTLGRADVLPVDDLGVREGYKRLMALEEAPKPKALRALGAAWSPWRSVATWYLWRVPR